MGDGTTPNAGHPDLTGRVVGGYGFGDPDYWADGHGHGTHTTGSAAADAYEGTGETLENEYYIAEGLAHESELFAAKIFDDGGNFLPSEYYPIVEVPAQQSHSYVHSNSWGSSSRGGYTETDEVYDQAVRDADRDSSENRPMTITVSAGNNGARGDTTTGSPGNAKNVITIGATHTYYPPDGYENAENLASFSSRGWTEDNRIKPDVVAPGENIYSLTPWDEGYQTMSGTSMSNPAVAGAASVVVQWYRENYGERPSPALVKSILINTAIDLDPEVGNTRGHIPNQDEGWGMVDISKLQYPTEDPTPFTFYDQKSELQTGDVQELVIAPDDESQPLNITVTWTDKNALDGDSEDGTPVLKNDLNLEVIDPDGRVWRGNAFNESADGGAISDSGYSYPDVETMTVFDDNDDGWDDINNVENVFIPSEEVEQGAYTLRIIGENIPEDATNNGEPSQDFAITGHNTRMPSDGVVFTDSKRYAEEDTVEVKVVDWDFIGHDSYEEVGIYSDTDPTGFNITIDVDLDSQELTTEVNISATDTGEDILEVSDGDYITVEYWDNDTGDGTGALKSYQAYVDGKDPDPPKHLDVQWWSPHGVVEWEDDVSDDLGYTNGTSHEEASTWAIRDHGSAVGANSWDWGDGWFNKTENEGMMSWLISPEIAVPQSERQMSVELSFQHWRDFGDPLLYDAGNLKISDQGPDGPYKLLEPEEGYDGTILDTHDNPLGGEPGWGGEHGWETVTFDISEYAGETIHLNWTAGTEGWHDEDDDHLQGEGWRIDDINVTEIVQGTDHNRLTWKASPNDQDVPWDDPSGHLAQYNIYRSDQKDGPWDETTYLASVTADRSGEYSYVDEWTGDYDDTRWWYVVRGEKDVGNEETNEIEVPEPGGPDLNIISPSDGEIFTDDEVTVEWNSSASINNYEVRLNENDPIDVGTSEQHTFQNLEEGTHKVSVSGYTADDVAFRDVEFIVDTSEPELGILYPEHGSYVNESEFEIEWEGMDNHSGIDRYEVRIDGGSWIDVGDNVTYMFSGGAHNQTYTVDVRAYDRAGFTTTATTEFTVDLIEPALWLTFPEDDGWAPINTTAEWESIELCSGIEKYLIRIPGHPDYGNWIEVSNEEYQFTDLEGEEDFQVEVIAVDRAGNYNLTSADFKVDPEAPHLNILYPEKMNENESIEYDIIGKDEVEVVWSRMDQYSGLSHTDIKLDDQPWVEDIGVPSSYTFSGLEDGLHTVQVRVTDNARQETEDNVTFMVDTSPPNLEITSPASGETYVTDEVAVEWEGSDNYSGLKEYEVRVNYEEWINVGLDTQYLMENLTDGDYIVEVRARNKAGYTQTEFTTFTVDTNPPSLSILSPTDGELFSRDEVTVKWEGSDDTSGIDHYEVNLDEGGWIDVGTSGLYTFKDLDDGERVVEVRAHDIAGNTETVDTSFRVDTASPSLQIDSPKQGAYFDEASVTAAWSSTDSTTSIERCEVRLDGGEWIEVEGDGSDYEYEFGEDMLDDSEHYMEVRATDEAGHQTTERVSFTIDTTDPTLSIMRPDDDDLFYEGEIRVKWSGNDDISGIDFYEIRVDEDSWIDVGRETGYEFLVSELIDGRHDIEVRASDRAGNSLTADVEIVVDTTSSPNLSIVTPKENTIFGENTITVKWSGTDEKIGIDHYEVAAAPQDSSEREWTYVGEQEEYEFSDLEDGELVVSVRAVNKAGNTAVEETNFVVDTTPPELSIKAPGSGDELQAEITSSTKDVTVEWSGESEPTDIVNYQIRVDDGPWIDVGKDTERTLKDLSDGEHTVEIRAEDEAGNVEVQEITFTVSEGFIAAYWWIFVIIALVVIAVIIVLSTRRSEEEEPPETEEGFMEEEEDYMGFEEPVEEEPMEEGGSEDFEFDEDLSESESEEPSTTPPSDGDTPPPPPED